MSKKISQAKLMTELSLLERDAFDLSAMWKNTAAAAAAGDASKVNDVLELDDRTNDMILTIKKLVVRMARGGFEAGDGGLTRCLMLWRFVAEMSVHYTKTVHAARRVAGLMREVQAAARGFIDISNVQTGVMR